MKYRMCCGNEDHAFVTECEASQYPSLKEEGIPCEMCDERAFPVFTTNASFMMKGDAWTDKNYRLKEYHQRKSDRLAKVQRERYTGSTLVPNYKGTITEDWREARALAQKDKASS